jgi:hypothetical protein
VLRSACEDLMDVTKHMASTLDKALAKFNATQPAAMEQ